MINHDCLWEAMAMHVDQMSGTSGSL